ncbi:hypothetical protein ACH5RR_012049 [Cinchona calisaya]|uniref:F-box/LRR-repeat protein 15/At3g58940/PEG3-like LRR domain-containing protein n=1 Tax=Cinchona calisaya TaxID=153742 RepID=A0ABD3A883_9GENT
MFKDKENLVVPLRVAFAEVTCELGLKMKRSSGSFKGSIRRGGGLAVAVHDEDQACVAAVQYNAVATCALKSTLSANNPSQFAAVQSCVAAVKIKNAIMVVNSTTSLWSAIKAHKVLAHIDNKYLTLSRDVVHNSIAVDTSKFTSNLATQGNYIVFPLDFEVDGGAIGPSRYILALSSTANTMGKVGRTPLVMRENMLGNEPLLSSNPTLDNNLMDVDDDPINSNLSDDGPINETIDTPISDDTCEAGRTSVPSKLWIDLWVYVARVDFDASVVLDKVLFDLDKFSRDEIDKWIQDAFARRVQRLELNLLEYSKMFCQLLEAYTFSFRSFGLKSHSDYCGGHPCALVDFKSLRTLSLISVNVSGEVLGLLLHRCPFLECLVVRTI